MRWNQPPNVGELSRLSNYPGAAALAGSKADIIYGVANTSTGTQDYTLSGFGTVDAYLVVAVRGTADGTAVNGSGMSVGFCDGTTQNVTAIAEEHGANTGQNAYRREAGDEVLMIMADDTGQVLTEANHDSFITDGVRLNFGASDGNAYRLAIAVFGGLSAFHVSSDVHNGAQDAEQNFNGIAARPDVVFMTSAFTADTDVSTVLSAMSLGFGARNATSSQCCVEVRQNNNTATVEAFAVHYASTRIMTSLADNGLEVTNYTSSGFGLTKRGTASDRNFHYLAMKLDTVGFEATTIPDASGTGNDSQTWPGFKPQFLFGFGSLVSTFGVSISALPSAGARHVFMVGNNGQGCFSACTEDDSGISDTQSLFASNVLSMPDGAGTLDVEATHSTFDATGYTWNYSNVGDGQLSILAIQEQQ